ncbi:unnamed protein product [Caenorhabditis sp. 36 PRJEB53466]|nr:unnamed protein product [Caenorhabditis sp. 36 PRJEB53466]
MLVGIIYSIFGGNSYDDSDVSVVYSRVVGSCLYYGCSLLDKIPENCEYKGYRKTLCAKVLQQAMYWYCEQHQATENCKDISITTARNLPTTTTTTTTEATTTEKDNSGLIAVGIIGGIFAFLCIIAVLCLLIKSRRKKQTNASRMDKKISRAPTTTASKTSGTSGTTRTTGTTGTTGTTTGTTVSGSTHTGKLTATKSKGKSEMEVSINVDSIRLPVKK